MKSYPVATADLVETGVFPSVTADMRRHVLSADQTLRGLQQELNNRGDVSWETAGVCVDVLEMGPVFLAGYVECDDLCFYLELSSDTDGAWEIEADVWVQSNAPVDTGQEHAADIARHVVHTPEGAATAFSAAATELAHAALSRRPEAAAWREPSA